MEVETGKHFEWNQRKLDALENPDAAWAAALEKCRREICIHISRKTHFGAHTAARLGLDAMDYYIGYVIDAVLEGTWQWKDEYTLSQQLCRIAGSVISTEVEKFKTERKNREPIVTAVSYDDLDTLLYQQEALAPGFNDMDQLILDQKIQDIETVIKGDADCVLFWECIKEGMKPAEIAVFMEKTQKQVYKLRDRFITKIKSSPYFESEYYAKNKH
jgi:hypothetical protein